MCSQCRADWSFFTKEDHSTVSPPGRVAVPITRSSASVLGVPISYANGSTRSEPSRASACPVMSWISWVSVCSSGASRPNVAGPPAVVVFMGPPGIGVVPIVLPNLQLIFRSPRPTRREIKQLYYLDSKVAL